MTKKQMYSYEMGISFCLYSEDPLNAPFNQADVLSAVNHRIADLIVNWDPYAIWPVDEPRLVAEAADHPTARPQSPEDLWKALQGLLGRDVPTDRPLIIIPPELVDSIGEDALEELMEQGGLPVLNTTPRTIN